MKLQSIVMPLSEFDHAEKGDALYGNAFLLDYEFMMQYLESDIKIIYYRWRGAVTGKEDQIIEWLIDVHLS